MTSVRSPIRWLAVAALVTILAFAFTYRTLRQSDRATAWVEHTRQTLSAVGALEGATSDLIFASTVRDAEHAAAAAFERVDALSALTRDNERQQARLRELRAELAHVVQTRRDAIGAQRASPSEAVVPQSLSRWMRAVRAEELDLLTKRVDADKSASQRLQSTLIVLAAGSGALLLWVSVLVVRDERQRRRAEAALRRANEELDARVSTRTAELHDALSREQVLRHEAETSSRLKDEFLLTVSHELRTPLNALLGWADMLRLGIVPADRQQRAIESIYENAKLQQQLIADLLDTGRILTGKLRIEASVIDLGQIVRDAASVVAPAADAKGLRLQVSIDPAVGTFVGDGVRMRQVVWNLVSNAVKFTAQGSVSVRVRRNDQAEVQIIVADTGPGIAEDFLPFVFDRFRQEKTGTARPHGGLGLGLAIVRQLVELHGGTIGAARNPDGHGAVFTVTLPAPRAVAPSPGGDRPIVTPGRDEMPALAGVRVLVVDDNRAAREMMTAALEHCGAHVTAAASADGARGALEQQSCDVLLIDIAMPDEDGYTLMRDIRRRGWRQPAVAVTAQARDVDRSRALDAGFDAHVAKPIEARPLAQVVAALVDGSRPALN